ncbi:hypothetical protein AD952_07500 [Acetobacter cerevisiae]|uniref:Uncharacterized protein n=1 Tax=Acetobacter cerevisiae TaxID=178900 RepID=A0A149UV67_9PROT|nr:hypothetical protein AD952_07500 [Acetobacter cerevisiae]
MLSGFPKKNKKHLLSRYQLVKTRMLIISAVSDTFLMRLINFPIVQIMHLIIFFGSLIKQDLIFILEKELVELPKVFPRNYSIKIIVNGKI